MNRFFTIMSILFVVAFALSASSFPHDQPGPVTIGGLVSHQQSTNSDARSFCKQVFVWGQSVIDLRSQHTLIADSLDSFCLRYVQFHEAAIKYEEQLIEFSPELDTLLAAFEGTPFEAQINAWVGISFPCSGYLPIPCQSTRINRAVLFAQYAQTYLVPDYVIHTGKVLTPDEIIPIVVGSKNFLHDYQILLEETAGYQVEVFRVGIEEHQNISTVSAVVLEPGGKTDPFM